MVVSRLPPSQSLNSQFSHIPDHSLPGAARGLDVPGTLLDVPATRSTHHELASSLSLRFGPFGPASFHLRVGVLGRKRMGIEKSKN